MKRLFHATLLLIASGCAAADRGPAPSPAAAPRKTSPDKISEFQGQYRFLSNFWLATVEFEGITYPSVEHAYQAAKTMDAAARRRIAALATPSEAKKAGRTLAQRPDWATAKFAVMEECVRYKFARHPELRAKLLETGDVTLEEGNTWGDQTWGVVNGVGENRLGKILMKVRIELRGSL